MVEWEDIKRRAVTELVARKCGSEYRRRLIYEIKEIEKQGANAYWCDKVSSDYKYDTNRNGLVLPWLLGMTPVDPVGDTVELKVGDEDGVEEDAIIISTDSGEIMVSPYTMVLTDKGYKRADALVVGDKL